MPPATRPGAWRPRAAGPSSRPGPGASSFARSAGFVCSWFRPDDRSVAAVLEREAPGDLGDQDRAAVAARLERGHDLLDGRRVIILDPAPQRVREQALGEVADDQVLLRGEQHPLQLGGPG